MNTDGLQSVFGKHLCRFAPRSAIVHLTFAYQRQGDVSQLHQVSAGSHAAMSGDKGIDASVDKGHEQVYQFAMDARFALQKRTDARQHGCLHIAIFQRLPCTGGMTADDVVLQVGEMPVVYAPLRHRTKPRIDAINHPIFGKTL